MQKGALDEITQRQRLHGSSRCQTQLHSGDASSMSIHCEPGPPDWLQPNSDSALALEHKALNACVGAPELLHVHMCCRTKFRIETVMWMRWCYQACQILLRCRLKPGIHSAIAVHKFPMAPKGCKKGRESSSPAERVYEAESPSNSTYHCNVV